MQIIVVHDRLRQARTVALSAHQLAIGAALGSIAVLVCALMIGYATFRLAVALDFPVLREVVRSVSVQAAADRDRRERDQVAAMAAKLGEIQAQMMRLDVLGERVSNLVGLKPKEFNFAQPPGRGGAAPAASRELSLQELSTEVDRVAANADQRSLDMLSLETTLFDRSITGKLLPTNRPIGVGYIGSGFGTRIDPFTGRHARHEGLDFSAPTGTPIRAAAGGIVIAAEPHPAYGNMVEIDHRNGLVTRYAHASKLRVKAGDIVKRGDQIADVGSTGRSTGPHLHFEVLVHGVAQNPNRYLVRGEIQTASAADAVDKISLGESK